MSQTAGRDVHATLYVRTFLPGPTNHRVRAVRDRLQALVDRGAIETADVCEWAPRVLRDDHHCDERALFDEFVLWARQRNLQLTPAFGTRECYSMQDGTRDEWLVCPVLCLAVRDGEKLVAVYPHTDGDDHWTVDDGLDAIAEGRHRVELFRAAPVD